MDQMQFFAYMYQMNTIALMNRSYPSLCLPSIFGDQNQQKFLEGDEKKYSRTWNKQQIHDAYMKTIKYSEDHHMPISALTLSDFEQISKIIFFLLSILLHIYKDYSKFKRIILFENLKI